MKEGKAFHERQLAELGNIRQWLVVCESFISSDMLSEGEEMYLKDYGDVLVKVRKLVDECVKACERREMAKQRKLL